MLTTAELHLCCVVKALFVATSHCYCYIGSMWSTLLLKRMFVDILLFGDPYAASPVFHRRVKLDRCNLMALLCSTHLSTESIYNQRVCLPMRSYEHKFSFGHTTEQNWNIFAHSSFCNSNFPQWTQPGQLDVPLIPAASKNLRKVAMRYLVIPNESSVCLQSESFYNRQDQGTVSWCFNTLDHWTLTASYSHLSWTLVNFQVGHRITSHLGISKLASGCSHTAAVPPSNR